MAEQTAAPLRWLHLDGLRITDRENRRQQQLGALVRAFAEGGPLAEHRPDLVLCTGDVAASGKATEYAVAERFFSQLQETLGLGPEHFFVVPGEHDLDRGRVIRQFRLTLGDRNEVDEFFAADENAAEYRAIAFRRFTGFADFLKQAFELTLSGSLPYIIGSMTIAGRGIRVLGLNSAWLATGDEQPGRLVVGERVMREALERLEAEGRPELVIALLHHPPEWLAEFERSAVKGILGECCDLLLCGHHPDPAAWAVNGTEGSMVIARAGQVPDSALLGEVAEGEVRLRAIVYQEFGRDGLWRLDPRLVPGESDGVWRAVLPRTTPEQVEAAGSVESMASEAYLRRLAADTRWVDLLGISARDESTRIPLDQVFIRLLMRAHEAAEASRGKAGQLAHERVVELTEAVAEHRFLVVIGDPGAGKTTFLRYVAHHQARRYLDQGGAGEQQPALPLLLPLRTLAASGRGRAGDQQLARRHRRLAGRRPPGVGARGDASGLCRGAFAAPARRS